MSKMSHHPGNTFLSAGVRSGAAATVPQDRPILDQPHDHTGALQNTVILPGLVNTASNRWPDEYFEDVFSLDEDIAAQGQRQDLGYNDTDHHGVVHHLFAPPDLPIPSEYHHQGINNHASVARDVPDQAQAITPLDPVTDMADRPAQNAPAGPAPAILDELPQQGPVPNEHAKEYLRQLANHFLNQRDSDVDVVHVEPSVAGGIRVVITLNVG